MGLQNPNGHRLYSTSNSHSNYQNNSRSVARAKSPRSVSYGNVMQSQSKSNAFVQPSQAQPMQSFNLLMPSERKALAKKQKKKEDKKKAQKIKESVGAFFHSFKSKNKANPKYSREELKKIAKEKEEYRAQHKDEDYYAYYGDPCSSLNTNPLSTQYISQQMQMELVFEDGTVVKVTPDSNMDVFNLIALALEKRGWSSSMSSMFNLCIKGDAASSDKEIIATLEDDAKVS